MCWYGRGPGRLVMVSVRVSRISPPVTTRATRIDMDCRNRLMRRLVSMDYCRPDGADANVPTLLSLRARGLEIRPSNRPERTSSGHSSPHIEGAASWPAC